MFSGIVESSSPILSFEQTDEFVFRLIVGRPAFFDDIKLGDSVATNGVCLTVVSFDTDRLSFDVAKETLAVTGWASDSKLQPHQQVNLERSLRFGDRVHGHFLSGHVDELGEVVKAEPLDDSTWLLGIQLSLRSLPYVWKKGSIGLSGVSLTVNEFKDRTVEVGLIPETLKLTNLKSFKVGDKINIEYDWMAKAIYHQTQNLKSERKI
ncbi:MAG: riboflavin synthase [Bdellovibrionaceae bacterium]|nr:riboflavin synthase [Pseudobdellovibrionaceae bacterium]